MYVTKNQKYFTIRLIISFLVVVLIIVNAIDLISMASKNMFGQIAPIVVGVIFLVWRIMDFNRVSLARVIIYNCFVPIIAGLGLCFDIIAYKMTYSLCGFLGIFVSGIVLGLLNANLVLDIIEYTKDKKQITKVDYTLIYESLLKLKNLKDKHVITEEEFERNRVKITKGIM